MKNKINDVINTGKKYFIVCKNLKIIKPYRLYKNNIIVTINKDEKIEEISKITDKKYLDPVILFYEIQNVFCQGDDVDILKQLLPKRVQYDRDYSIWPPNLTILFVASILNRSQCMEYLLNEL